jgi:hypothetical protein
VFQKGIVITIVTLERNKGYRSTLGMRDEVRVTIEAFTFLRKGFAKIYGYPKGTGLTTIKRLIDNATNPFQFEANSVVGKISIGNFPLNLIDGHCGRLSQALINITFET